MKRALLYITILTASASCLKKPDYRIDIGYTGEDLRYINCPLGGIGTGNLLINGYGGIDEMEIFNGAAMDEIPPEMTFFSLYTKMRGEDAVARIMEREHLDEYPHPFGMPPQQLGGLPRFREARFHNAYPFIRIDLFDEEIPLDVKMEAWSPFIPVDTENSGIPGVVIEWRLTNRTNDTIDYSIAMCMGDPFRTHQRNGLILNEGCTIEPAFYNDLKGIQFSTPEADSLLPGSGQLNLFMPPSSQFTILSDPGEWRDEARLFWDDFSVDGILGAGSEITDSSSHTGGTAAGYLSGSLAPGESHSLPFLITWYIPWISNKGDRAQGNGQMSGPEMRNYYADQFSGIAAVSGHLIDHFNELRAKTKQFSLAMITSTVPKAVLDAGISNMAALKTNLMQRDISGRIHAYEGLGNSFGYSSENSAHVWNYAQTRAMLFPSLERGVHEQWIDKELSGGQMGNIIRIYREWKMVGSSEWLGKIWPGVKRIMEYTWSDSGYPSDRNPMLNNDQGPLDPGKDGILHGQHTSQYDVSLFGSDMMTGSLYLGALKACSEMAIAMNEPQRSLDYMNLYKKGAKRYMELLWNGKYFIQDNSGGGSPDYQLGKGCFADQLLGQYLAFNTGMGYLLDTVMVNSALMSIYENNFKKEMRDVYNVERIFAANGEPGLVLCTWPEGDRPQRPFVYSDEVWTGVEYQVAASMIHAGMVKEGLTITEAARSRYSGNNRNPFAEIESGRYFARSQSSWSVYQAMSGYVYDGIRRTIQFNPAVDALPFRFFWSSGSGWGTFEASRAKIELKCLHGNLDIEKLLLKGKSFFVFREFDLSHHCNVNYNNNTLLITFPVNLSLQEGESFIMSLP